jgi:hypothetical protein
MSTESGPAWLYDSTQDLDLRELEKLGPSRPTWTHHFTTWQAFKNYVSGVRAGKRADSPTWYSPDDWLRACAELDAERPQCPSQ